MFRLVSAKDYPSHAQIEAMTAQLRSTFSKVFADTYTKKLAPALKQAIAQGEVKTVADTKTSSNDIVKGFSDLLTKPRFFDKPITAYARKSVLREVLKGIYYGAGFDDDAAFVLAFHDFDVEANTAAEHYARIKNRLPAALQQEVEDYFPILAAENRILLKADFLAIVNDANEMQGFALLHVLKFGDKIILHVRQAAMLRQGFGFVSAMAASMVEQYPHAIYEANQRIANRILMKENLAGRQFIERIPAVLNYPQDYYFGWRGIDKLMQLFLRYQQQQHAGKKLFARGFWNEAESVQPFFSRAKFNKDLFALQDDNFCQDEMNYLRRPVFRQP